jgi:hypothetical protein
MKGPVLSDRINAFCRLGELMLDSCQEHPEGDLAPGFRETALNQYKNNSWFDPPQVFNNIQSLADNLTSSKLSNWLNPYSLEDNIDKPKKIGVIMAGNIPLVAFHDFLSILLSGNIMIGKTSSKDTDLIVELSSILCALEPAFKDYIHINSENLDNCDAIIATGSNNSARYFEYHYGGKAHIFRKNRNSIAIIDADTTYHELQNLGKDVFDFYGLGCRSVSKIFVPEGFDIGCFQKAWSEYSKLTKNKAYNNNYSYNKAILSLENASLYDLDFVLLKEDAGYSSPVAVIYFSYYNNRLSLKSEINSNSQKVQAIVGNGYIPFGLAQSPELNDYADGIDTIEFLINLS